MDESVQFRLKARSTAAVDDPLNFLAPQYCYVDFTSEIWSKSAYCDYDFAIN
jgi:hypothetical protein